MAIDQKIRSLYCGIPAGVKFTDLDGRQVVQFRHVPFELEDIVQRWVWSLTDSLRAEYVYENALTFVGWSAFVSWMLETLRLAQSED